MTSAFPRVRIPLHSKRSQLKMADLEKSIATMSNRFVVSNVISSRARELDKSGTVPPGTLGSFDLAFNEFEHGKLDESINLYSEVTRDSSNGPSEGHLFLEEASCICDDHMPDTQMSEALSSP